MRHIHIIVSFSGGLKKYLLARMLMDLDWMQEGICADAASFDLPAAHLATCIQEAKSCVDLALARRGNDNAADTSIDPDNFAVLKGIDVHFLSFSDP